MQDSSRLFLDGKRQGSAVQRWGRRSKDGLEKVLLFCGLCSPSSRLSPAQLTAFATVRGTLRGLKLLVLSLLPFTTHLYVVNVQRMS